MNIADPESIDYACFARPAGQIEYVRCRVCGTACDVEKNKPPLKQWYARGSGMDERHDLFCCPYANDHWHERALKLFMAAEETPSKRIAQLIMLDLADVLDEHGIEFRPEPPQWTNAVMGQDDPWR